MREYTKSWTLNTTSNITYGTPVAGLSFNKQTATAITIYTATSITVDGGNYMCVCVINIYFFCITSVNIHYFFILTLRMRVS